MPLDINRFPIDALGYIDQHPIPLDHQPALGAAAGISYQRGPYTVASDALYSSGLATGFADTQSLPETVRLNASLERTLPVAGAWAVRFALLNVFDRINAIRARNGIGIFQAAYAPRRTAIATVSLRL